MANGLIIKIDGDDSGFKKALSGIGNVAQKGLGITVKGIAAASAALGGLTALAVKGYAEYEQLIGGVDTLFETSSENVKKNAANAYKTAGLSANEYMETAMSFAASLKQSFDDTEEGLSAAAKAADMAVIDMADNANKMGTSMELIQNAYQGFAKQNYTMLDNLKLGYGGTKEEMQRLLADAEKLSGIKYDISNLADVYEAIHVIQTEIGITGTTAKEASETISGSVGMMKASWENLIVGMSDKNADLDGLMQNFLDSVLTVGDNLMPAIETALNGIGDFISDSADTIVPQIIDIIISAAPDLSAAAIELIRSLCSALIDNAPEMAEAAKEIVTTLIDEIENSIPALKPFTSLTKGLVENLDNVAVSFAAVTAAIIAYRTTVTVSHKVTTAWTAALAALNAMEKANAITLTATNGGLTAFQTLVGLVTGKITLQTAATGAATAAQNALNTAMKANPTGLLIAGIAAVTAGLVTYAATHKSTAEEIQKSLDDIRKSHEDAIKSIDKTVSAEIAEAETAKALKKELYELEEQINSGTLSQDEAREAQENFNIAANELNEIIPGIISSLYNETNAIDINRGAVDDLTDSYYKLAVAKTTAAAYEKKMTAVAEALIDAKDVKKEAHSAYTVAKENYYRTLDEGLTPGEFATYAGKYDIAKKAYEDTKTVVADLENDQRELVKGYTETQKELNDLIGSTVKSVEESNNSTTRTVRTGNTQRTASTKSAAEEQTKAIEDESKKQEEILKEQREKELRDLNFYHDMEEISDAEYYTALGKYRDKYFEEGSEEWQRHTLQIYNYNKKLKEEVIKDYEDILNAQTETALNKISELENAKKAFSDKLKNYGTLYNKYSLSEITLNNGLKIAPTKTELADLEKQNAFLRDYADALKEIKKKSGVPQEFISKILNMSAEEGYEFAKTLLSADETVFNEYIKNWNERQTLIAETTEDIYSDEFEKLKTSLEERFGQLPEDFFGIGEESAKQYGEGFMSELYAVFETAKHTIRTALNSMIPSNVLALAGGGYGNVNNYSATYYVQPSSGESTQAQLKSIHDYETLNAQRSGY